MRREGRGQRGEGRVGEEGDKGVGRGDGAGEKKPSGKLGFGGASVTIRLQHITAKVGGEEGRTRGGRLDHAVCAGAKGGAAGVRRRGCCGRTRDGTR